jgi:glycerate 2-kinase
LEDYIATNQLLSNAGARIEDWNAVRKHMDAVKGGRLALAAGNAKTIVNLMLSDVTGDRMDVIASGPFTPDPSTFEEALMVLEKYKIRDRVPRAVLEYLEAGAKGKREETAKEQLPNLHQLIVSSNTVAVNYVAEAVREWGYEVPAGNIFYDRDIAAKFKGVRNVAEAVTEILTQHRTQDPHRKIAIILGGEPTVNIGEECPAFLEGVSFGGRMQHLAALLIEDIAGLPVIALCAGTDCRDGTEPPEARKVAGAIIDGDTYSRALQVGKGKLRKGAKGYLGPLLGYELWELAKRVIPEKVIDYSLDGLVAGLGIGYRSHLEAGDSYDLHKRLGTHLGPERFVTNVMDVMVILYDPNLFERSPSIIPGLKRAGR